MKTATHSDLDDEPEEDISIHAVMKTATGVIGGFKNLSNISIHAVMKTATKEVNKYLENYNISIHAVMKTATRTKISSWI